MNSKYAATLLVRGSIQSIGSSSRVGVRMIDLDPNIVAWSDKYQFNEDEIFDIQDKPYVLNQLHLNIITGSLTSEFIKKFGTLENLTIVLNARNEWRKFTPLGMMPIGVPKTTRGKSWRKFTCLVQSKSLGNISAYWSWFIRKYWR